MDEKDIETSEQRENNQSPLLIPFAIIISGVIIASAVIYAVGGKSQQPSSETASNQQQASAINSSTVNNVPAVTSSDHILGSIDAPVKIVEYSDLECPYCKMFDSTMHQIVQAYGGKVAWVYRQYPIPELHPKAPHESVASECAAQLGGNDIFWKYIDEIFKITPSNNGLDPSLLTTIATGLGLDSDAFNTCLSGTQYDSLISRQSQDAVNAGAQGTPYSIIISPKGNKYPIDGAQSYSTVKQMIDAALSQG